MQTSIRSTAELAKKLGLSRWTVSRALNCHPEVNAETAERVRRESERLGFSPSILGRGLRRGRTDLIGVVVPDLEEFYLTRKVSVLRERIEKAGLHGVFQITDSMPASERAALERFSAMRCAGVVNFASRLEAEDPALQRLVTADIPVVQIDPRLDQGHRVVTIDRAAALRDSVKHLAELGHRKIAILGVLTKTFYGERRKAGLVAAARALKWDFHEAFSFYDDEEGRDVFEVGTVLTDRFLRNKADRSTAIIAMNDRIALGALGRLNEGGLKIPDDISLLGYDDADFAPHLIPALTTLNPQVDLLMHRAMDALLASGTQAIRSSVRPRLVVRESTGRPARRSRA